MSGPNSDFDPVEVTPLRADMTNHQAMTAIETWNYLKDSELLHKS